jgi:hypothetical protein
MSAWIEIAQFFPERRDIMFSLKQTKLVQPPAGIDPLQRREGSTTYLYAVTVFVSLGAFLFGYDQGVMGVIVADQRWIDLMHPKNSCEYHRLREDQKSGY